MSAMQTSVCLDVVGTGSDGTESSVVFSIKKHGVYSDDETVVKRYMFNCGEGTQRLCNENRLKLGSLTSMHLTRLDPLTCSGIPGMILALGGCGTPDLSIVGPSGTHAFVTSTKSFARRNYPAITCTEVDNKVPPPNLSSSHIRHTTALSNEAIVDDRFVRITPLSFRRNQSVPRHGAKCRHCQDAPDQPAISDKRSATAVVSRPANAQDQPMLEWLKSFYQEKEPSKVAYVPVILSKYQGRHDDLKRMLVAKYGPLPTVSSSGESSDDDETPNASSSSSGTDGPKENEDSPEATETLDQDKSARMTASSPKDPQGIPDAPSPMASSSSSDDEEDHTMERWLRDFYTQHNPSMVSRLHSVLQMYAGREDQLKTMLEQKYVTTKRPLRDVEESASGAGPEAKKPKTVDIQDVYVTPPQTPRPSTIQHDQILCYVLEFKGSPNAVAWVVDVPDLTWLPHITSHLTSCAAHPPSLIVHLTPAAVAMNESYIAWVRGHTTSTTRHLLFDGQLLDEYENGASGLTFTASAQLRLQLHSTSPSLFPLSPPFQALATSASGKTCRLLLRNEAGIPFHVAQPGLSCQLTVAKASQQLGFHHRKASSWHAVQPVSLPPSNRHDHVPKLTFLGTGCAAPSKLRNSSAIFLEYNPPSTDGILIDCGEGTFGQLWRQFGPSTPSRLRSLQCIWVSHKHADHHCGLLRVLLERHRAFALAREPATSLVVIAPDAVLAYVARWQATWLAGVHMVTCTDFNRPQHPLRPMVLHLTGFQNLWSVPVHHCHDSFGLVLITHAGMKVVYSGDTRPCDLLIHEGFRPHVLIHEATFEDVMFDDALKKNHSTVGEAFDVGRRMQAHLVLLTHFSQRYPKLPPRQAAGPSGGGACGFAFDGMQVALEPPQQHHHHHQYMHPPLPPRAPVFQTIEATLASFMTAMRNDVATAAVSSPPPSP